MRESLALAIAVVYGIRLAKQHVDIVRRMADGEKVQLSIAAAFFAAWGVHAWAGHVSLVHLPLDWLTQIVLQQLVHDMTHQHLPRDRVR